MKLNLKNMVSAYEKHIAHREAGMTIKAILHILDAIPGMLSIPFKVAIDEAKDIWALRGWAEIIARSIILVVAFPIAVLLSPIAILVLWGVILTAYCKSMAAISRAKKQGYDAVLDHIRHNEKTNK